MAKRMNYSRISRKPVEMDTKKAEIAFSGTGVVMIFTDGSCLKNPGGQGGWAAIIRKAGVETEMFGCALSTTNNAMELMGAIMALESLTGICTVIVATDSQYLVQGASKWLQGWKRRGWKTAEGSPVKNMDLWIRIDRLNQKHCISWNWVRGHNGHVENERCDVLAGIAAKEQVSS